MGVVVVVAAETPHADVRHARGRRARASRGDLRAVARHREREHLERVGAVLVAPLQAKAGVAEIASLEAVRGAAHLAAAVARHDDTRADAPVDVVGPRRAGLRIAAAAFAKYESCCGNIDIGDSSQPRPSRQTKKWRIIRGLSAARADVAAAQTFFFRRAHVAARETTRAPSACAKDREDRP